MGAINVVHVAHAAGGWRVVQNGSLRSVHRTQKAAIDAGKRLAERARAELVTHERNGAVRLQDSSPLVARQILESPGRPSVSKSKIAAAVRSTIREWTNRKGSKNLGAKHAE